MRTLALMNCAPLGRSCAPSVPRCPPIKCSFSCSAFSPQGGISRLYLPLKALLQLQLRPWEEHVPVYGDSSCHFLTLHPGLVKAQQMNLQGR